MISEACSLGTTSADVSHACLQAEFHLGNVEDGFLPSAFLAGLLIASIVYSELTTRYNAFRMTGVHMLLSGSHCQKPSGFLILEGCIRCMQGLALQYMGTQSFRSIGVMSMQRVLPSELEVARLCACRLRLCSVGARLCGLRNGAPILGADPVPHSHGRRGGLHHHPEQPFH